MKTTAARKIVRALPLLLALLSLLVPAPARAQTRIRLATLLPRGSSQYHSLEEMGQQWRAVTKGGVTLTIYADGTMGSEEDTVRRMRVGQLQAATLSVGGLSEIDTAVGALQKIPMLYRSLDEVEFVRTRMRPELEQRLEQKGFVALFWGDIGWVNVFSRQPALRPDEFKKTKVFVGVSDRDEATIMKSIGFQVVPLEWSDVLTSLQTGLVDTVPTPPMLALAGQFDLVAKNMLELNYVPLVGATVVTKKAWDEISPEKREALLRAASEAGAQMQTKNRNESKEAVEAMRKRGLHVHPLTPELENEWRRFLESSYPRIRGTMVPVDVFDEVRGLLAEYRAAHAGKEQADGH